MYVCRCVRKDVVAVDVGDGVAEVRVCIVCWLADAVGCGRKQNVELNYKYKQLCKLIWMAGSICCSFSCSSSSFHYCSSFCSYCISDYWFSLSRCVFPSLSMWWAGVVFIYIFSVFCLCERRHLANVRPFLGIHSLDETSFSHPPWAVWTNLWVKEAKDKQRLIPSEIVFVLL